MNHSVTHPSLAKMYTVERNTVKKPTTNAVSDSLSRAHKHKQLDTNTWPLTHCTNLVLS